MTDTILQDAPLFRYSSDALLFAYRYSGQQYSMSAVAKMMGLRGGSGKGLSGLDGAAQAGMIKAEVDKLHPNERDCMVGRFADPESEICKDAKKRLIPLAAAALPTGMHSRRMVAALVQRYFGKKATLNEMVEEFGVPKSTLHDQWRTVAKKLRDSEDRASHMIHDRLVSLGIVE